MTLATMQLTQMIDADAAPRSQVVPKFLLMPLLRHVMVNSCTERY